jgi:uncharacterized protein (DUF362 family)
MTSKNSKPTVKTITGRNAVVITKAPEINFRQDFVTLPRSYGTPAYFNRADIQAMYHLVDKNLSELDTQTGFITQLRDKKVVVKPNLVTVYSQMGLHEREYPETTDPRLLDALVAWLKHYTTRIVIAESSGRGVPTRGSFRVAGLDRLARYHKIELMALEEQPTDRYFLPQARIQKEIIVPHVFRDVIAGEAFFISVPKMKTNLYTEVTLGFKNIMGVLPYNLRQRNHNFGLNEKLVDTLYLLQPNLTLIDGLVGGEGNCPAPVDPVDSRVIISGTNCLETDRVAARLMGFDPQAINLIKAANSAGFGDPDIHIVGEEKVTPYQPADPSLYSPRFKKQFPHVRVLIGRSLPHSPCLKPAAAYTPAQAEQMAMGCRGGCLASTRFGFEMFFREGLQRDFQLTIIIGDGALVDSERIYLDENGKPYTTAEIDRLPGKKLAIGSCTQHLAGVVDRHINGCMPFPNQPHIALHRLTGKACRVLSLRNNHLIPLLFATVQLCQKRKRLYRSGLRIDCEPSEGHVRSRHHPRAAHISEKMIIPWPLPPLTREEIKELCARENRSMLATFLG